MKLQPHLKGPRIGLRPLLAGDFEALFAVASDPLLWQQHPKRDRYQRPVFEKFFNDALASAGALVVVENATGRLIGCSRYYGYDAAAREVCIGFTFLGREFWGGATNKELKSLMLAHAFEFVDSVIFHVGRDNMRSRRAMEKIGGILSEEKDTREPGTDNVIYRIRAQSRS